MNATPRPLRVLIADDHAPLRAGIREALEARGFTLAAEAADAPSAVAAAVRTRPDIALIDLDMPGMDGFHGLEQLRTWLPNTPIVIVSAAADAGVMRDVIRRGAKGYIVKSASAEAFRRSSRR